MGFSLTQSSKYWDALSFLTIFFTFFPLARAVLSPPCVFIVYCLTYFFSSITLRLFSSRTLYIYFIFRALVYTVLSCSFHLHFLPWKYWIERVVIFNWLWLYSFHLFISCDCFCWYDCFQTATDDWAQRSSTWAKSQTTELHFQLLWSCPI